MEILLKNIKKLRTNSRWSQENMAEELKMSLRMYSAYERGESKFNVQSLIKIAEIFGVKIDDLYKDNVLTIQEKNKKAAVSEPTTEYVANKEQKKVSIELDLGNTDELNIFKMYLGSQFQAKIAG